MQTPAGLAAELTARLDPERAPGVSPYTEGFDDVALYDGSWNEWSRLPYPVE